ncbi:hypothetical protein SAMD00019534_070050, partial [Acytostelium subglobosum LB1]|uniref:hypothetical protein n=1 Tax=Acytostelium subglobosum LB1 TaxID=1410327 RepID=UPI000644F911
SENTNTDYNMSQLLLPNYSGKLSALRQGALGNANFLTKIAQECNQVFMPEKSTSPIPMVNQDGHISFAPDPRNIDKVKSTIRQFAREWSVEGKKERDTTFLPILERLESLYPDKEKRSHIRVYCPGAGLGRLCLEVVSRGFSCQGIEFSYFMLLSSSFILNKTSKINEFTIYPFIHQSVNVLRDVDQIRPVKIPDVLPHEMIPNDDNIEFSMVAGDFTKSVQDDHFDSVCTCFFIDTARNIVEYVECLVRMLKEGGHWINFGPLLYHYADNKDSIELSYEQLRYVILNSGFDILHEELRETEYTSNKHSLMKVIYNCQYFVAIKKK